MDPRQLQMLLMMAQSQPQFLVMMGMEGKLKAELDKREKLQEIQNMTSEAKRDKDRDFWNAWLEQYESALVKELTLASKE